MSVEAKCFPPNQDTLLASKSIVSGSSERLSYLSKAEILATCAVGDSFAVVRMKKDQTVGLSIVLFEGPDDEIGQRIDSESIKITGKQGLSILSEEEHKEVVIYLNKGNNQDNKMATVNADLLIPLA